MERNLYSPNRGSEWRKWDLHIHTPESGLSNAFNKDWDLYVKTLFKSAINNNVAVLGITDYFSIDGYKKLKYDYIENNSKLDELFDSDAEFIKKVKSITLFPNIEFRLNTLINGNRINYHVIFSDDVKIEDIEDCFLHEIDFIYNQDPFYGNDTYKLKKRFIEELGAKLKKEQPSFQKESDFTVGCMNAVVNDIQIREVLEKHNNIFKDKYMIVIPVDEDLSHIKWEGQGHQVRKGYYQHAHAFFTSNKKTIEFALGGNNKDLYLKEFKSFKPCFIGCDAHSCKDIEEKLGKYFIKYNESDSSKIDYESKTTWIKADTSFEGLRQTLFEPESRVRIQSSKPEEKSDRLVISSLKFKSDQNLFGEQEILLSENLNSIIGGKSSGKSLLLHSTAFAIDRSQVNRISSKLNIADYTQSMEYDLIVTWKDGFINTLNKDVAHDERRRITYIPQLYINYLAEKDNKEELNDLLLNILLQNENFKLFYSSQINLIQEISKQIDLNIGEMFSVRDNAIRYNKELKEIGDENAISKSIQILQKQLEELTKYSSLNELERKEYTELCKKSDELNKQYQKIKGYVEVIEKIKYEFSLWVNNLLGTYNENGESISIGKLDSILNYYLDLPQEIFDIKQQLKEKVTIIEKELYKDIINLKYNEKLSIINKEIENNSRKLIPFTQKLKGQKEITNLQEKIRNESAKLNKSQELKKKFNTSHEEYRKLQKNISKLLDKRISIYKDIEKKINQEYSKIGEDITLYMNIQYPKEKFEFYEQVNKNKLNSNHEFYQFIDMESSNINYNLIPSLFSDIKGINSSAVLLTNNSTISYPINKDYTLLDIYRGLVVDNFILNFDVKYKNDNLLQMSPGKKGTVLLILFLYISSADYPILIDQPEDNLDNRTIYELLCQMIRIKKIQRQILIVSHNANLVVATDSENIIVANQEGQIPSLYKNTHRFDYVNGALEFSFVNNAAGSILLQKGIKQHVCDILEGGNEAFKRREQKYSLGMDIS